MDNFVSNPIHCHKEHISHCFFRTQQANEILENCPEELTLRERQLLRSLNSKDELGNDTSDELLKRLPVLDIMNKGLIEQHSPCVGFCQRLQSCYQQAANDSNNTDNERNCVSSIDQSPDMVWFNSLFDNSIDFDTFSSESFIDHKSKRVNDLTKIDPALQLLVNQ